MPDRDDADTERAAELAAARRVLIRRHRMAIHESAHATSALAWGIPVRFVTIEPRPEIGFSLWFNTKDNTRLERLAAMLLAGPVAEEVYCGSIENGTDRGDREQARAYLVAAKIAPGEVEAKIEQLRAESRRMLQTRWARRALPLIADALLRAGSLTGEQVRFLCAPLHDPASD